MCPFPKAPSAGKGQICSRDYRATGVKRAGGKAQILLTWQISPHYLRSSFLQSRFVFPRLLVGRMLDMHTHAHTKEAICRRMNHINIKKERMM